MRSIQNAAFRDVARYDNTPAKQPPDMMKKSLLTLLCALCIPSAFAAPAASAAPTSAPLTRDIIIYGDTSAAIAAAVQARRMGKTVVIVGPSSRPGGLTTGGLGQTDVGNRHVIGGIAREFYRAVREHYQKPGAWKWQKPEELRAPKDRTEADVWWIFEPHVALNIYNGWLARDGVDYIKNARLDRSKNGIIKNGSRIVAIRDEAGREYRGKIFIDATYEGDLMALAGIKYTIGREANSLYDETLNGVQTAQAKSHQFVPGVDPYIKKGDPSSGLLPFIDPDGPGVEGAGDRRVQAYCYRMCLTDHPGNKIPFIKPEGYREDWYELLFRNFEAGNTKSWVWINSPMPNRKTDTNNRGGFSTDFIGQNYDYPEADYKTRGQIARRHLLYQQGLMWALANHPRVPAEIRDMVSQWGMTKDEFTEGGGWQEQLYIREARRMVSDLVMTQHHCQGREVVADSIGMAAYTMDSHHVQRHVDKNGHVRNEGDVQVGKFPPYPVGYGALVPRRDECENLLVPVCVSASHIAYGSIRMEPVFMVFGQSAATAAALAIDAAVPVQKVDYAVLRARLLKDGQILENPRSAATAAAVAGNALGFEAAVAALHARGVIGAEGYWLANARPGKKCAGENVGTLIQKAVAQKKAVSSLEVACDHLHASGLMARPGDWKKYARSGKTCTGASVEKLIVNLELFTRP